MTVRRAADITEGPAFAANYAALRDLRERGIDASLWNGESEGVLAVAPDPMDAVRVTVDRLLDPGGCPWDRAQTHASIRKDLLEEAYETVDAIDRHDLANLCEELGDLLLHILLHAGIERRAGGWDEAEVARGLDAKLIARHPHVFGEAIAPNADTVLSQWDRLKAAEKPERTSALDGVPLPLPALSRALAISKKAAKVGFEWPDVHAVLAKLDEEREELYAEIVREDPAGARAELGDLLFTAVNIARWLKIDPEEALREMVARFERRFRIMEEIADRPLNELDPSQWETAWSAAKLRESSSPSSPESPPSPAPGTVLATD